MTTPSISIIGCGRVGTALAVFLTRAGFPLAGVASRSLASARNTARLAGAGQVFDTPMDAAKNGEIIFITTQDAAIEKVFSGLVAPKGILSGKVVFHCSGALSSGILTKGEAADVATGSIHPLQSFAPYAAGQVSPFEGINISVEGDDLAVVEGIRMVEALGGVSFTIPTRAKTLYHAAAVVASNYLVTLERFAVDLLQEAELPEARAYEILEPLILGTLSNIKNRGTVDALTGPVVRGDKEIVARHMADIQKVRPEYSELYRLLGQYTLKIAREGGSLAPESADRLETLFKPPGS
jgi:predicted short-subunit dehydrogenase-like oxidoreductase (DUF2520 family)